MLEFIDLATRAGHLELQIEETGIAAKSSLVGMTPASARLAADLRVLVVALRRSAGQMIFNPPPTTEIAAGDTLIAIGSRESLDRLRALAAA